ncbi:hypothetical protein HF888_04810 [Bermanella marisrubri]|uniref:Lipoprotein n=1 Tax=Bermanella marisrubri TaxID=207949 RepID=Q1N1D2_9GAMM|nr:hypothetical protein [Bermanella marisrubri]EAT12118.1 hypothetical protein RED65_03730 [Oceanobacter sp. RED65] [Bermanella marisrubri]QIZ83581.1 hypothetical protein HF888_04810 [Bermanella marisrubri]
MLKRSIVYVCFILALGLATGCGEGSTELNASNIGSYPFDFLDIEQSCEIVRESGNQLGFSCKQDKLKPVERGCAAYINSGLRDVSISCGGELWEINDRCSILMTSADKGELNCKI